MGETTATAAAVAAVAAVEPVAPVAAEPVAAAAAAAPSANDAAWADEGHWNGGLYFAKEDTRLFVPKKVAWMGWTLNLGHAWAPAVACGIIALPAMAAFCKSNNFPILRALKIMKE